MPKHRECETMPRLFTGLEIPAEIGQSLSNLRGGLPGARWIDPENYHVTLRFIGNIDGMSARLNLQQGPMLIAAEQGRYNIDTQQVAVVGPINVHGADGWQLQTRDVTIDLKQRQLASQGPAEGKMRLGQFRANHIRADLASHTVVLDGGARLKIVQGTVR